ncbi:hypothetical protein [Streptomyces sp. ST2-7A]|uniref:hypothetical protein n=1 Tax=Streptomyces sp. ST2-7A TaxID=2907214 RepID=UPI001F17F7DF|nr:hypothetical protein [Streptomyces sp. ST2-7A]MCE7082234.1 hypothetical protein [Streptomyces sp. ST2-7A]
METGPLRPRSVVRRSAARRRPPRPPRGTPPREELARRVRTFLDPAVRLARWAERHGLDPAAEPDRAARDLDMSRAGVGDHWSRARLAGLIEPAEAGDALPAGSTGPHPVLAGAVRAGWRLRAWDSDDSAVLRGWVALFDGWSLVRPAPDDADPIAVTEVVGAVPQLLSVMHLSDGPVTAEGLCDLLLQRVAELRAERPDADGDPRPVPEDEVGELTRLLGWALDALSAVGALTLHAGGDLPVRARLTPLGGWAVWTRLEQICLAAQSPAGLIEQSAVAMLRACADLTPGPARDEYRAWLAARTTGPAVAELLEAARGEDALIRGHAFEALRVVGAPARAAVRAAVTEPVLRPYALLWLAEQEDGGSADAAAEPLIVLTRREATWLWVDTASAVHDHSPGRLLIEQLEHAPTTAIPELLEDIRGCGHPRTVQVLLALAAAHPEPPVARRIRRAAFQLHTGGTGVVPVPQGERGGNRTANGRDARGR